MAPITEQRIAKLEREVARLNSIINSLFSDGTPEGGRTNIFYDKLTNKLVTVSEGQTQTNVLSGSKKSGTFSRSGQSITNGSNVLVDLSAGSYSANDPYFYSSIASDRISTPTTAGYILNATLNFDLVGSKNIRISKNGTNIFTQNYTEKAIPIQQFISCTLGDYIEISIENLTGSTIILQSSTFTLGEQ